MCRYPRSPYAAWLLIAAFVFQLSACQCGCLEHNAWVRTAAVVLPLGSHSHLAAHPEHSHGHRSPGLHQESHDCDGQQAANVPGVPERWRGFRLAGLQGLTSAALPTWFCVPTVDDRPSFDLIPIEGLPPRAHSQVFLL